MIYEHLLARWFVANGSVTSDDIEAWVRKVREGGDVTAMSQFGPGRGRLAGGIGALVLRAAGPNEAVQAPEWAAEELVAEFRLRQIHAPRQAPDPHAAPTMLVTRTYVPLETREEFRRWLELEHSQRQLEVPGNHWYVGYEEVGGRQSFMNFWGIDGPEVADGPEWDRARLTPWRERMVPAMAGMDRGFYRPVPPEPA